MKIYNVFDVQDTIERFGIWYAIWFYGFKNSWSIFVACMMIRRAEKMYDRAMQD